MSDFDRELEQELRRILDPISAVPIPPRRSLESGGTMKKLLGGAGAAVGLKILTGIAAAAAAITVAGAATEVATTGSLNPNDWGQQVTQQVQTCKDTLRASGTRGIGQCVSQFAKQHGATVSDTKASGARANGNANGKTKGNSSTNPNSHGKNKGNANGHGNGNGQGKGANATTTSVVEPEASDPPARPAVSIRPNA
jgi:hypothetical protein